jgi:S-adenosylmethionine:tRNA ribosyltransferase-isomerase
VRYEYIQEPWNLDYYQTVFATIPGSVEMPSAGRAFSWELLFRLQKKGVRIAYITLHTGLSYLLDDKWHKGPDKNFENYEVPKETADLIRVTKKAGGRVIAVGTTVVRALETVALEKREVEAHSGWTNLYITEDTKLEICDGLITGMHEPEASHLQLLSAFVDKGKLYEAYQDAIKQRYLWHEFGDMNLII